MKFLLLLFLRQMVAVFRVATQSIQVEEHVQHGNNSKDNAKCAEAKCQGSDTNDGKIKLDEYTKYSFGINFQREADKKKKTRRPGHVNMNPNWSKMKRSNLLQNN